MRNDLKAKQSKNNLLYEELFVRSTLTLNLRLYIQVCEIFKKELMFTYNYIY